MRMKVLGVVAAGLLLAGCGGGAAGSAGAAPAACIDALDKVSDLRAMAAEGLDRHMATSKRVNVALDAGLRRDAAAIDDLNAEIRTDAAEQVRYNQRLGRVIADFEKAEAACRQAG